MTSKQAGRRGMQAPRLEAKGGTKAIPGKPMQNCAAHE